MEKQKFTYKQTKLSKYENKYRIKCFENSTNNVGSITFEIKGKIMWLHHLLVKAPYRRQHIGKELLKLMENFARENQIYTVKGKFYPESDADGVRTFYETQGYVVPNKTQNWETYDDTWVMYKNLGYAHSTTQTHTEKEK